jgi:hypothetical protein
MNGITNITTLHRSQTIPHLLLPTPCPRVQRPRHVDQPKRGPTPNGCTTDAAWNPDERATRSRTRRVDAWLSWFDCARDSSHLSIHPSIIPSHISSTSIRRKNPRTANCINIQHNTTQVNQHTNKHTQTPKCLSPSSSPFRLPTAMNSSCSTRLRSPASKP